MDDQWAEKVTVSALAYGKCCASQLLAEHLLKECRADLGLQEAVAKALSPKTKAALNNLLILVEGMLFDEHKHKQSEVE